MVVFNDILKLVKTAVLKLDGQLDGQLDGYFNVF